MSGSPFSLAGKQVLVTGADGDIGAATARLCERMGAHVIAVPAGSADVAALPALDACVFTDRAAADPLLLRDLTRQHLDNVLALNCQAPLLLTQALLAAGRIRDHASLVYVTGATQHWAFGGSAASAAGNAALNAAVRALATELAPQSIRANCVAPGTLGDAQLEGAMEAAPLGAVEASDVAAAIAWLLAPASRWVSRSSLLVDGGLSLHVR